MTSFFRRVVCRLTLLVCISALVPFQLQAKANHEQESREQEIIAKVIEAYGGKTLVEAKSIKLTDYNKGPWPGESEHPGVPEIWRINEVLTIDFQNQRKSLLSYRVPRSDLDLEKWIFEDGETTKYDILYKKHSLESWATYDWMGGSIVRSSDTMHAIRLHRELKQAAFIGTEFYRGKVHQKLAVTFESGAEFTYYIDRDSGLIMKSIRQHPRLGNLTYVFSNHQRSSGVVFAADMNLFVGGELRLTSVERNAEVNVPLKEAFNRFDDFTPWGEEIDSSSMMAKQISKGVYQAGKGRALSLFVEHDDHFVALGDANQLKSNFEELKKLSKTNKPIKFFIATHHHRGNLAGLDKVLDMGAKIVASQAHLERIKDSLPGKTLKSNLISVPDRKPFSLGKLQLFDIATAHSQHYLLAYLAESKTILAEEHYETQFKSGKPRVYRDMVLFRQVIDSLPIDIEHLVDSHSWRRFTMDEFRKYTDNFVRKQCPQGYSICAKG